jgi:hypothetical protein
MGHASCRSRREGGSSRRRRSWEEAARVRLGSRICASDPGLREGEDDARSDGEEGGEEGSSSAMVGSRSSKDLRLASSIPAKVNTPPAVAEEETESTAATATPPRLLSSATRPETKKRGIPRGFHWRSRARRDLDELAQLARRCTNRGAPPWCPCSESRCGHQGRREGRLAL